MKEYFVLCFVCSYHDRYWRPSAFDGVQLVQVALDKAYGPGEVNLVSAVFRWLNHHSCMSPEYGGSYAYYIIH